MKINRLNDSIPLTKIYINPDGRRNLFPGLLCRLSTETSEQGTHEQLIAMNGFYTELYNSQFTSGKLQKDAGLGTML